MSWSCLPILSYYVLDAIRDAYVCINVRQSLLCDKNPKCASTRYAHYRNYKNWDEKKNTTKKKMKWEENNGLLIATSPTAKHLQIAFIPIYKMQNHSIKFIQTVRCAAKRVRCIRFVCPLDCETRWIQPKTPNSSKLKMTAQHKMNRNDCLNSDERVCASVRASVCICKRCAFKTLCNGLKSGHRTYVCVPACVLLWKFFHVLHIIVYH